MRAPLKEMSSRAGPGPKPAPAGVGEDEALVLGVEGDDKPAGARPRLARFVVSSPGLVAVGTRAETAARTGRFAAPAEAVATSDEGLGDVQVGGVAHDGADGFGDVDVDADRAGESGPVEVHVQLDPVMAGHDPARQPRAHGPIIHSLLVLKWCRTAIRRSAPVCRAGPGPAARRR